MKRLILLPLLLAGLMLAACSTTESRIGKQQALFDSYPADVQRQIKAGDIQVGFTPEMVKMSVGDPARTYTRTTAQGTAEVWSYDDSSPKFSIGLGVGSFGRSGGVGGGVSVGSETFRDDETMRVIFEGGKVASVERKK